MNKSVEISLIENTLKLMRRGKFELNGEEAIVFYSCFQYLVKKLEDLKKPEIIPQASTPLDIHEKEEDKKPEKKKKKVD